MELWQVAMIIAGAVAGVAIGIKVFGKKAASGTEALLAQAIDKLHQSVPAVPRPAPVAPAPQIAPEAPIPVPVAPTPVPIAPAPPVPNPAPWGYTDGPNGRVANTGPNLGFGYSGFGVPNQNQAESDRWGNLKQQWDNRETPSMSDAASNAVLATFDAEPDPWIKWYHISAKEQLALVNRMVQAEVGRNINEYNGANGRNLGEPPGWKASACYKLRGD